MSFKLIGAGILVAVLVLCVTAFPYEERLSESVPVGADADGTLFIDLPRGNVEIRSHAQNEVKIEATARGLQALSFDFTLASHGDDVELSGDLSFWRVRLLSDLDVVVHAWVPETYSVDLRTARGSVDIAAIRGDVDVKADRSSVSLQDIEGATSIESSRGNVTVRSVTGDVDINSSRAALQIVKVAGEVNAATSRGAIAVRDVSGDVRARTSRADIEITDAGSAIDARSSRGSIDVRDARGTLRARTSRAPIFASFSGEPSGDLRTSRSEIEIAIPKEAGVDLEAETSRGLVYVSDDFEMEGSRRSASLYTKLNGGGERLRVQNSRGAIRIRTR